MRRKTDHSVYQWVRNFRRAAASAAILGLVAAGGLHAATPAAAQEDSVLVAATSQFAKEGWEPWLSASGETPIVNTIGETLLQVDPATGELVGGLAESWSLSDDLLTWSFKLRPDVPFHGGHGTVTAEDVKFSWEQFTRPESTYNLASLYRQAIDGNMDNFVITGPLEFELRAAKPVIFLPTAVSAATNSGMKVQSKAYWDQNPEAALRHPIGTGPYQFVSYNPGIEVELEAVEDHWRATPAFKRLIFKIIDDEAARLNQVAGGQVDIAPLNPRLLGEAENLGLKIFGVPGTGNVDLILGGWYPGIGDPALGESEKVRDNPEGEARYDRNAPWIQADNPEKGLAIRQALSLAIDREAIVDVVMSGRGELLTAPFVQVRSNPALNDPSWTVPPYDPERARELLAEGGYPDGFEVTLPMFEWQDRAFTVDIAEAIAGMWEAIGIKVNRMRTDYQFYRDIAGPRTSAGMAYASISTFNPEPAQTLISTFLPTSSSARLYDPSISTAVSAMSGEPDQAKRLQIAHDLLGHLREQVIGIPVLAYESLFVASPKIGSWQPVRDSTMNSFETMTASE